MKPICAKFCTLVFFALVFLPRAEAQDQVILLNGDTLECAIYKENNNFLFFKQKAAGVSSKGKISKNEVAEWTYRAADVNQAPVEVEKQPESTREITLSKPYDPGEAERKTPFRVSLNAGSGLLIGDTEKPIKEMEDKGVPKGDAENYTNDLVTGHTGKFTVHYQLWKNYWLGVLYNGFYTDAKILTRMDFGDGHNWIYGEVGEKNYVNFVGPSFFSESKFGRDSRFAVHSSYSIGPAFYRNEVEIMRQQILLSGVALGQNLDLGFAYFIKPQWAISLDASIFASQLRKMTVKTLNSTQTIDLEKEDYNNLSRLEMSFGVVFYW